ncbi:MAG: alpha/beta fold hydrolase [Gammaproteobacteria bacterium]
MAAVTARMINVNGLRSPCLEAGTPTTEAAATEAVVFVHGNPGASEDWRDLVGRVGEFGRALALDMPGFGKADKPADFDYTVAGYAAHLEAALQVLGVTRVHLCVHDFGGPWGLAWAAQHPARVASVTLFNIGILPGYRWHFMARIWRLPLIGELAMKTTTRAGFRALLKLGNPRGLPPAMVERMYEDFDAGTQRAVLRLYRATNPDDVGDFSAQVIAALRPRDLPALVVWGERDIYLPSRFAEVQKQVFPRARIVRLTDSGHWPFADNPDAVAGHVIPFLREQMRDGAATDAQNS